MALALVAVAFLLTYLVHSTMLLGGAWALSATGVVKTPHARDWLWKVCLAGGLVTATVQAASPYRGLGRTFRLSQAAYPARPEAAPPGDPAASGAAPGAATSAGRDAGSRASVSAGSEPAARSAAPTAAFSGSAPYTLTSDPGSSVPPIWLFALGAWMLIAAGLLVRLAVRRRGFCRRLASRHELTGGPVVEMLESLRVGAGVRRRIRLRASADLTGPVAMGSSEICLPERALTALSAAEQRAVLAHELAHLVRRDPVWLAVSVVVENLFFFQPLNRLARQRGQEAAELICDDWAVHHTGASLTLAKCLAEVATWMHGRRGPVPIAGMAEHGSQLVRRVQRLLNGAETRSRRGLRLALPVGALALSTMAFAAPNVAPPYPPVQAPAPLAPRPVAAVAAPPLVRQGEPHTWATVRGGRLITFSRGWAPRISGTGRIGIRRGGRAIELVDGQRLEVNGRDVAEGADIAVPDGDTLRIKDGEGRVEWTLDPVRVSPAPAVAWAEPQLGGDSVQALADLGDSLTLVAADLAPELARIAPRVAAGVRGELDRMAPELARLQDEGVREGLRIAATVAPRLAELSARISAQVAQEIGPAIARAFGDSACDADSAASRRPPEPNRR